MASTNSEKKIDKNFLIAILVKYFNFVTAAVVLIILVFGYFYFIGPSYRDAREEIDTLEEARQTEYNQLTDYSVKIRNYLNDYNRIKKDNITKIDAMIPGERSSEDLYKLLEMIVLKNGSIPTSISVGDSGANGAGAARPAAGSKTANTASLPELGEIAVTLEANEVDYNGLKKLLSAIENSLRIMDITKVDFSPQNKKVNLNITAYYYKNNGNGG